MRTLLRHTETGLFLQGPEKWTEHPESAYDFRFIDRAKQFAYVWGLDKVEVAFAFDDCQLVSTLAMEEVIRDAA